MIIRAVALLLAALFCGALEARAELTYSLSAGYRVDDLNWNKAGFFSETKFVDVLSELTWEDLEIFQLRLGIEAEFNPWRHPFSLAMKGKLGTGWIDDGQNQDSDFAEDGRNQEFSRSNNNAGDGEVFDASFGIGPKMRFDAMDLAVTPLAGYSVHRQDLTLSDGFQTLSNLPGVPGIGPFPGLDSEYDTQWWGPWLGFEVALQPLAGLSVSGSFEYHRIDYEAQALWNLRSDLAQPVSFEHTADGQGIVLSLSGICVLSEHWLLSLDLDYLKFEADDGRDLVFPRGGGAIPSPLNEVNWESMAAMVGIQFQIR